MTLTTTSVIGLDDGGLPTLTRRPRIEPVVVTHPVPGQQVEIVGTVDARSVAEVRAALLEAVDNGVGELVVNVGGLELGDATGLGALLGAHRRALRSGRSLVLDSVGPTLYRVLTYTRLIRVLATRPAQRPAYVSA
jgi:anti-anti-sigma factor